MTIFRFHIKGPCQPTSNAKPPLTCVTAAANQITTLLTRKRLGLFVNIRPCYSGDRRQIPDAILINRHTPVPGACFRTSFPVRVSGVILAPVPLNFPGDVDDAKHPQKKFKPGFFFSFSLFSAFFFIVIFNQPSSTSFLLSAFSSFRIFDYLNEGFCACHRFAFLFSCFCPFSLRLFFQVP